MKHIIKKFTVQMPRKMAKEIKQTFDAERKQLDAAPYMLAIEPIAATGACRVAIISKQFGVKIQKLIDKHKNEMPNEKGQR